MVTGSGMMAKKFEVYASNPLVHIFAAGVSNSKTQDLTEFKRESALLSNTIKMLSNDRLIYFSTCSMYDDALVNMPYVQHKLEMENLVAATAPAYSIMRLSNPVGHTHNQHTVVNFLYTNILHEKPFELWMNAGRNILDIDDVFLIARKIIDENLFTNSIVNIAHPCNYTLPQIVAVLEKILNKKAMAIPVAKGGNPTIDITAIKPVITELALQLKEDYLDKTLRKYFTGHL